MKKLNIIAGLLDNLEDMVEDSAMHIAQESDMQRYIDMAVAKLEKRGWERQMNGRYKKIDL